MHVLMILPTIQSSKIFFLWLQKLNLGNHITQYMVMLLITLF